MNFQFSESTYKLLKFVAVIGLPALASFVAGFAALWGIPNTMAIVGTITLTDTLLGSLLTVSTLNFNKTVEKVTATVADVTDTATDTVADVTETATEVAGGVTDDVEAVVEGVTGKLGGLLGGKKNKALDADTPSHRKET